MGRGSTEMAAASTIAMLLDPFVLNGNRKSSCTCGVRGRLHLQEISELSPEIWLDTYPQSMESKDTRSKRDCSKCKSTLLARRDLQIQARRLRVRNEGNRESFLVLVRPAIVPSARCSRLN